MKKKAAPKKSKPEPKLSEMFKRTIEIPSGVAEGTEHFYLIGLNDPKRAKHYIQPLIDMRDNMDDEGGKSQKAALFRIWMNRGIAMVEKGAKDAEKKSKSPRSTWQAPDWPLE